MANKVFRPLLERFGGAFANTYIGTAGDIFYDPDERELRLSDGVTPGGNTIGFGPTTSEFNSMLANTNARINLLNTNLIATNTAVRLVDSQRIANTEDRIDLINTNLTGTNTALRTLISDRAQVANLAVQTARVTLVNSNLTGTNTALRTLISDRAQVANLATQATRINLVNTNLTGTNTAVRSLVSTEAARVTLVNTNLTGTNTAVRSLVSTEAARVTLVNTNLTGTNTAIRLLVNDRAQVANVSGLAALGNTNARIALVNTNLTSSNTALRSLINDKAAIADPTFTGTVAIPTLNITSALQFGGSALTTSVSELNTFDKSLTRDASTSDMASPALTKNFSTFTNVITLDGNLSNDARTADLVISNNLVTATSVIVATANVDVRVETHTVIPGSFRASFHNTSGAQIDNDTNFKVNYMVL